MADATLTAIRKKARRITRNPNVSQLSNADLDEAINTFILYDMPSQLRLFNLRKTLTFYTQPNADRYETINTPVTDPLYNFKNRFIAIHPPVYIAGVSAYYTQNRGIFYGLYPQTNAIIDTKLRGDGTTGPFAGTISSVPFLKNSVVFSCVDTNNNKMVLVDYPSSDNNIGFLGVPGLGTTANPAPTTNANGQVNYVTGAYSNVIFTGNTLTGAIITLEMVPYKAGKPIAMLYFEDAFVIRPVPDKVYPVQIEVDAQPTELLAVSDVPDLEQWWQYVAYGASKKIFEDRMQTDDIQRIMPEFKQQERMVLRTTIEQQTTQRAPTIFSQGKNYGFNRYGGPNGGWPF
jgi:hypothetical protein